MDLEERLKIIETVHRFHYGGGRNSRRVASAAALRRERGFGLRTFIGALGNRVMRDWNPSTANARRSRQESTMIAHQATYEEGPRS